jgi:hypothetical protein
MEDCQTEEADTAEESPRKQMSPDDWKRFQRMTAFDHECISCLRDAGID